MSLALKNVNVITLFTEDLARTRAFYEEVLGLPVSFEKENTVIFTFENVMINLVHVSGAPEFIAPTAVARPEAGSRFLLAMSVDDVDAACAELARHGVALLNGPIDRPWGVRTASFTDPAGHIWEVAQDLG